MQILSSADFYLDHLDGRTPIVVISSMLSPVISPPAGAGAGRERSGTPAAQLDQKGSKAGLEGEKGEVDVNDLLSLLDIR